MTDLAGAEPTPLKGSEKFVLKFPHPVLHSFIASFSIVGTLVNKSETEVFELLLNSKWASIEDSVGLPPTGPSGIALMRLITQVQHLPLQQRIVSAWRSLSEEDASILSTEMALSGVEGQTYARCTEYAEQLNGGPCFLVYYSPAFLRNAARQEAETGLRMLADIYRQARSIWPFSSKSASVSVTIRIDQIKEHQPEHIMDGYLWGEGWLLVKRNEREAVIEHHSLYMLQEVVHSEYRVLAFWPPPTGEEGNEGMGLIRELEEVRAQVENRRASPASQSSDTTPPHQRAASVLPSSGYAERAARIKRATQSAKDLRLQA
uniref:Uncharacterized protein n=1 Tax=Haptolina brevifila TaxID=156173 RepID=A0A7S2HPC8_9EUKA